MKVLVTISAGSFPLMFDYPLLWFARYEVIMSTPSLRQLLVIVQLANNLI